MVYKRIKKGGSNPSSRGGPNDKAQFNSNKIGEATAKRMQDKLGKLRKSKNKDDDDEIKSNDSDAYVDREPTNASQAKRNELLNDPFL